VDWGIDSPVEPPSPRLLTQVVNGASKKRSDATASHPVDNDRTSSSSPTANKLPLAIQPPIVDASTTGLSGGESDDFETKLTNEKVKELVQRQFLAFLKKASLIPTDHFEAIIVNDCNNLTHGSNKEVASALIDAMKGKSSFILATDKGNWISIIIVPDDIGACNIIYVNPFKGSCESLHEVRTDRQTKVGYSLLHWIYQEIQYKISLGEAGPKLTSAKVFMLYSYPSQSVDNKSLVISALNLAYFGRECFGNLFQKLDLRKLSEEWINSDFYQHIECFDLNTKRRVFANCVSLVFTAGLPASQMNVAGRKNAMVHLEEVPDDICAVRFQNFEDKSQLFPGNAKVFVALSELLKEAEHASDLKLWPYLWFFNELQKNWKLYDAGITVTINSYFIKCTKLINSSTYPANGRGPYLKLGRGLLADRLDFLESHGLDAHYRTELLLAFDVKYDKSQPVLVPEEINYLPLSNGVIFADNPVSDPINLLKHADALPSKSEFIEAVFMAAAGNVVAKDYDSAARWYSFLRKYATTSELEKPHLNRFYSDLADSRLLSLDYKILLDDPKCFAHVVYERLDGYKRGPTLLYATDKPMLLELEKAADFFRNANQYEKAIRLYVKLLEMFNEYVTERKDNNAEFSLKEEEIFVKFSSVHTKKVLDSTMKFRDILVEMRGIVASASVKTENGRRIASDKVPILRLQWNEKLTRIIKEIVAQSMSQFWFSNDLALEQVKFAVALIGSGAKGEYSLYSDFDLLFITEKEIDNDLCAKQHFKSLIDLIKVKVTGLGEWPVEVPPIRGDAEKYPIGIHVDYPGKLFPQISGNDFICIGTKEILPNLDYELLYRNAIQDATFLCGEEDLFQQYFVYIQSNVSKDPAIFSSILASLGEDFECPKLTPSTPPHVNVKEHILRYPTILINRLYSYYCNNPDFFSLYKRDGAGQTVTEFQVDLLVRKSESVKNIMNPIKADSWKNYILWHFNDDLARKLKRWLRFAYDLRFQAHFYYGCTGDDDNGRASNVCFSSVKDTYCLNDDEKKTILSLYVEVFQPVYEYEILD
jgi:hypothetical protein